MLVLQEAGVPAGVVKNPEDIWNDPQLRHRGHYSLQEHPEIGICSHEGHGFVLSETPAQVSHGPLFGEHNEYVLLELLGIDTEEYIQLVLEGVLE